jgi:Protein of unknown function (DUF1524)/Protein of unknown function DUF262
VQEYISVKVLTLKELFCGTYHFRLPFFQRAYAWETQEIGRLLTNIIEAMNAPSGPHRYFLGKLMLAQETGASETALVDGHQRVMSLTILFSVLRDLAEDEETKQFLNEFIGSRQYRLSPQESLADFCHRYVQAPGSSETEPEEDFGDLSETERNILENRNYLRAELAERDVTSETRKLLIEFLANKCCVIVSSVEDEDEAWRILRIEEETRVDFNATDRAKSSLLSIVPPEERGDGLRVWEDCEKILGRSDMYALLGHLRMLKLRKRSDRPIEIDIAEGFHLDKKGAAKAFLEGDFLPAATRLASIRRGEIGGAKREVIAESIERTSWIDSQLWVPPVLQWLAQDRDANETASFFAKLERLVWIMRLAGLDPTKQQRRMLLLLTDVDRNLEVGAMRELEIGKTLRSSTLANLRSKTFDSKRYTARVLRRLSIALDQDPGPIHPERLTIEHVLPKSWSTNSGWRTQFATKRSVQTYAHRLGNLTFLTATENQKADTLDWSEKRRILSSSKLVLSNRMGATVDWTPDAILNRTEDMIRILFDTWDMKI